MNKIGIKIANDILRGSGAQSVSIAAALELGKILDEDGRKIADSAFALAKRAGRNTLNLEDIRLATV